MARRIHETQSNVGPQQRQQAVYQIYRIWFVIVFRRAVYRYDKRWTSSTRFISRVPTNNPPRSRRRLIVFFVGSYVNRKHTLAYVGVFFSLERWLCMLIRMVRPAITSSSWSSSSEHPESVCSLMRVLMPTVMMRMCVKRPRMAKLKINQVITRILGRGGVILRFTFSNEPSNRHRRKIYESSVHERPFSFEANVDIIRLHFLGNTRLLFFFTFQVFRNRARSRLVPLQRVNQIHMDTEYKLNAAYNKQFAFEYWMKWG